MSFYTRKELEKKGFKFLGENIFLSRKASIYSPEKISIGSNVRIDDFCILSGDIKIGNYVHVAVFSALFGGGEIEIEDYSGLSSRVTIYSVSDDYSGEFLTNPMIPEKYKNIKKSKVLIKKHSIIGTGTVILPGITLEEGTAVGANSLVLKNTEKWGIYAGLPAKKIKERKKDLLVLEQKFLKDKEKEEKFNG